MTEDPKQTIIDEAVRLMNELNQDSCEMLLERVKSHHKVMTTSIDEHSFVGFRVAHVRDQSGQKPLCGQGRGSKFWLVSKEEFEKLTGGAKCCKCKNSLKKLRGEKIPYERENWLMKSQEELIIAIYFASGRNISQWCTIDELFKRTKYKTHETMREALRRLKSHGIVEMKRIGKFSHVRLALNCVIEIKEGEYIVDAGMIIDAAKPKYKERED